MNHIGSCRKMVFLGVPVVLSSPPRHAELVSASYFLNVDN